VQNNAIKVIVAGCFGVAYVVLVYFDLSYTCKGSWWCIHWAVVYVGIGAPVLMGLLGFVLTKERRIKHALLSLAIGLLAILIAMYVVNLLNDVRIARDTREGEEAEQELMQAISQSRTLVDTVSMNEQLQCIQSIVLQGQQFAISSDVEYQQLEQYKNRSKTCMDWSLPVIDFSRQVLLGKYTAGGGCEVDFGQRLYKDDMDKTYMYIIDVKEEGTCQKLVTNMNWILAPKPPEDYELKFIVY